MPPLRTLLKLSILPLAGILIGFVAVVMLVTRANDPALAHLVVPGKAPFAVTEPGQYTVWRQLSGVSPDNEFVSHTHDLPPGLHISIAAANGEGTRIPLQEASGTTIQRGADHKTSLFTADLPVGSYELNAQSDGDQLILLLDKDPGFKQFLLTFLAASFGFTLTIAGLVIALVVIIKGSLRTTAAPEPPPQ